MRTEQAPSLGHLQNLSYAEQSQTMLHNLRFNAGRIAASLLLTLTGAVATFTAHETIETSPAYADTGGYPDANAPCYPNSVRTNADGSKWCAGYDWRVPTKNAAGTITSWPEWTSRTYGARNCTDYVAWRINHEFDKNIGNLGNATTWNNNAPAKGFSVDNSPEIGDIAQFEGNDSNQNAQPGHVAFVEKVNDDGTITISEYNHNIDGYGHPNGTYGTRTINKSAVTSFIDVNGPNSPGFTLKDSSGNTTQNDPNTYAQNTIRKVVKKTDNGTNLVFWAKSDTVFEDSWRPGGDGVHVAALTNQPDIKDIDVQINADHERLVYTATGDGHIYETWYYPGQPIHTGVIASGAGAIKEIQKTIGPDGTQQLYVMTDQGIDEYWWRPGGDGIHKNRLYTLRDPVSMVKIPTEPDGTQIIYVADQSYVYETYWKPGSNINVGTVMSIPQADITDIDAVVDPDGKHHVYAGRRRDGIWEAGWYRGQAVATRQIAGGDDIRDVDAFNQGATHQLYAATGGGVFEYYWQGNNSAQGSTLTLQPDVHTIDRSTTADGLPAVYTGANTKVYETWWGTGQVPQTGTIS